MKLNYQKRGSGEKTLLLGHGFPFNHTMWHAQLADLADEFTIIAPDFRGMGDSPTSGCNVTQIEEMADDLAELLDTVGIQTCTYCGLSMGGYIGLEFWKRHAHRLNAMIFCDTNARSDTPEVAAGRFANATKIETEHSCAFMADGMIKNLMTTETIEAEDASDPTNPVTIYRKMVTENNPVGVASVARGMAQRKDFTAELNQIRLPALVLVGEKDVLSPPDAMRTMAEAIPEAEFVVIPCAAHLAPLENAPAVNRAIRNFMKKW